MAEGEPQPGVLDQLTPDLKTYYDGLFDKGDIQLRDEGGVMKVGFILERGRDIYRDINLRTGLMNKEGIGEPVQPAFLQWARELTGWQPAPSIPPSRTR